jgi:hypothetical protein
MALCLLQDFSVNNVAIIGPLRRVASGDNGQQPHSSGMVKY